MRKKGHFRARQCFSAPVAGMFVSRVKLRKINVNENNTKRPWLLDIIILMNPDQITVVPLK